MLRNLVGREMRVINSCRDWRAKRRERVAIHQRVQLRLRVRQIALQIPPRFLQLAIIGLGNEHIRRALQTSFVSRAADISDLFQRSEILAVDLELVVSIRQLEVSGARLRDHIELSASRFFKSRKRFGRRSTATHQIFAGDRNQLLDGKRLIHERIRRNIDKAPHA